MTVWQTYKKLAVGTLIYFAFNAVCLAEKLEEAVQSTVRSNPSILMQSAIKYSRANAVRESTSGYLPKIDIFASYGRDHNKNFFTRLENSSNGGDGSLTLTKREAIISIRQMLFDGFDVRSQVEANSARDKSSGYNVLVRLNDVILEVTAAYIDTIMLRSVYMHAKDNVAYHQQLIDDLTNNRISDTTAGDLDFAKSRLSLAQTTLLDLQRSIRDAQADYLKIVGKKPGVMYRPESPERQIPNAEEAVVAVALKNNPLVFVGDAEIQAARAEKRGAKAPYFPRLDLELAGSNNKNVDGYNQSTNSLSAMLQLKYNLFNGGKDIANERKTAWILEEKKESLNETLREIEQRTRHIWSAFVNYKGQLGYLKQRVDALEQTRNSYYKEFTKGEREIYDLLDSEEELYNAKVNYVTAQYKELFSRYMILQAMGKIREYFNVPIPASVTFNKSAWMSGVSPESCGCGDKPKKSKIPPK